jgi:hypothetical protein
MATETTDDSTTSGTTSVPDDPIGEPVPLPRGCSPKLLCEDFDYPPGDLENTYGWVPDKDVGGDVMQVVDPGVSFPGHPGDGVGYGLRLEKGAQEGPRRYLPVLSEGKMFVSFTINVEPSGPALSRQLLGITSAGIEGRCGTLVVQSDRAIGGAGDNLAIGLDVTSNPDLESTSPYKMSPYLNYTVVYEKDITEGLMQVYLLEPNTPIPDWPPTPLLMAHYSCDPVSNGVALGNLAFGPGSLETTDDGLRATIDGIRVATSWEGLWTPE